ncbi:M20/M25/M40 family metallo-hydrolase [Synergistaceae bacterium OttesenSCG-928-I11]|nr:M20/M25/M40 family metallo-hydrolase [Synergistaceae bacterium OttesenSCG-928-I11]
MAFDAKRARDFVEAAWRYADHRIGDRHPEKNGPLVNALEEYIEVPNLSPAYDAAWAENSSMDRAVALLTDWVERLKKEWAEKGCKTDDVRTRVVGGPENPEMDGGKRRTPLVVVEVPAFGDPCAEGTILLYGHLDKQPHLDRALWTDEFDPVKPVIKEGRLYGRGGADDGYALFGALAALMALREQGTPHARAVIVIEAGEESGSPDLEYYIEKISADLGDVTLIVCLDSGCGNYDQLWTTNALRGLVSGVLTVNVLTEGIHSGEASGAVPSSFRILRQLLSRVEDEETGEVKSHALKVVIPTNIRDAAKRSVDVLGPSVYRKYPFVDGGVKPVDPDPVEVMLNRTWRTQLAVIGMDGLPKPEGAGNVMLPHTRAALSFRLPPTLDSGAAATAIEKILETDPPYGAHVSFETLDHGNGWAAVEVADWLRTALEESSKEYFGTPPMQMGEGGSIPFMDMLAQKFPRAQFMITGVLGPGSNAHGPKEFLDIPTVQKLTASVARVIAGHADNA